MDIIECGEYSKIEYWKARWQSQDAPWHKCNISSTLLEFFHLTISKLSKPIRVLVPLCGKSLDIKWIGSQEIEVVGLEGCREIIEAFYNENDLTFKTTEYNDSVLFKCQTLPISIYQCDIFNFDNTKLGKFNVIFDQGSLVAIDSQDRLRYRDIMNSFLMEDFQYILDSITCGPPDVLIGPPHNLTFNDVQILFGDYYCELLKERDSLESGKKFSNKFEYFNLIAIRISPKHFATNDVTTLYHWNQKLANKDAPWHKLEVHSTLIEKFKGMIENLKTPISALVPLCGKSLDLKWLADQGILVTGVEGSKDSIEEFFADHALPFKVEKIKEGIFKYTCQSIPLTIYNCNFFRITEFLNEKFNFIWDRGSLVAIDPIDRKRYANVMQSNLANDFEYLLEAIEYGPEGVHKLSPHSIKFVEVNQLFGNYKCEILNSNDATEHGRKICDKFEYYMYNTIRISPKK